MIASIFRLAMFAVLVISAPAAFAQSLPPPGPALAGACPPNSRVVAIAIPGNLRSAQCFCNDGYIRVSGACERVLLDPTQQQPDPSRTLVEPRPR